MKEKNKEKYLNLIIALIPMVIATVIIAVFFDHYFDLNDDVLIKDIISGAYSGTPEARNIQMLFFISNYLKGQYKISRIVPWYGFMLWLFQYASIFLIVLRSLKLFDKQVIKCIVSVTETFFFVSIMLMHLVNLQYTVTVAFMCGAAIVWFLTVEGERDTSEFIVKNIPALIIIYLAYLLRSEMLLLMLPFIGMAGIIKWSLEKKIFTKENIIKYLSVFGIIVLGIGVGFVSNRIAYSSDEWKEFTDLFNARTELYDFQVIPSYEGNEAFYESIDISKEEQVLFENYNYGLNPKVTGKTLWKIAAFSEDNKTKSVPTLDKLKDKTRIYIYEITHGKNSTGSDYPFNIIAFGFYAAAIAVIASRRKLTLLADLIILFIVRSAIWVYMLMGERMPERITHSLYFIEICVVLGLILAALFQEKKLNAVFLLIFFVLFGSLVVKDNITALRTDQALRKDVNAPYLELYDYMESRPENLYLLDVYSTVSYSEKAFGQKEGRIDKSNSELLGGWFWGSPTEKEKIKRFGYENMEEALTKDNVYFVKDTEQSMDYLIPLYESKGKNITVNKITDISGVFEIYEVRGK